MADRVSLPASLTPFSCAQILIADDSDFVRNVVRIALEKEPNLRVCGEAADGPEVINKAKVLTPDVIVLDLAMPTMNGLEVAAILRQQLPSAVIILLTVYENALGQAVGSSVGARTGIDAALSKHEGIAKLVDTVQSLVKSRESSSAPAAVPAALESAYDIFRIEFDGKMRWLEAAVDLGSAKARLQTFGATSPGRYMIFSQATENKLPFEVDSHGALTSLPV